MELMSGGLDSSRLDLGLQAPTSAYRNAVWVDTQ